ncbi:MAG: PIG-L family deacetylase [Saprospiraceae bacterium]|nr:PIG-L family deacetylase [Saprospiraceae bacterium]
MIHQQLLSKYLRLKEAVYKKYARLHHVEFLEGPRILVLSPHPDDDVFGCGGALIRHINLGHQVFIAYVTDGSLGITGKGLKETVAIRKAEAVQASSIIGVPESALYFLQQPDGNLEVTDAAIQSLKAVIAETRPNLIYLPSFVDNHSDHFQTNLLLNAALTSPVLISAYEIWTPIIPNRLVDVSGVMDQKITAMKAHQSQLEAMHYAEAMVGLNTYRALMYAKKRMRFAEAFLFAESREYFELIQEGTA